jgi:hypothetical protein
MRRLVLGLVVLAGVLALGEGASRVAERVRCRPACALYWDPHPRYGWGHAPGASGWCQGCFEGRVQWRMRGRFNRAGLRDERDIPYARQDGTFRILVLGDSYTEGLQVDVPYTRLLEERLNAAAPAGRRFEVLNAAVAGWGTDNAFLWFVNEGWKYHADLVLLAFDTGNDVFENHRPLIQSTRFYPFDKPFFTLSGGRLVLRQYPLSTPGWRRRVAHRLGSELVGHSALFRFLSTLPRPRLPRLAHAAAPPTAADVARMDQNYLAETPAEWQEAWRISRGLVLKLRAAVEGHGSRFAVAIVNGRDEVTRRWRWLLNLQAAFRALPQDFDKPHRLLTGFLTRRGIPFVPMLEEFRAAFGETGTPGFFPWDVHWAPAGHELAARLIERSLRARGLVPLPPAGASG